MSLTEIVEPGLVDAEPCPLPFWGVVRTGLKCIVDIEVKNMPHKVTGNCNTYFYGSTKDGVGKRFVEVPALFLMSAMNTDSNLVRVDLFDCIDYHLEDDYGR